MSNILITFGGAAYDMHTDRLVRFVQQSVPAVDQLRVYDDRWLTTTPFYEHNYWIFQRQPAHGFGFCSWKPYIIKHALHNYATSRGDVVMYVDGDTVPIADFGCLFERASKVGVMLFEEQGCINKTWIKADCFDAMQCDGPIFTEAMHACGRFQLFRKGDHEVNQFLEEWQTYSLNPKCQFHEGSVNRALDHPSFIRNSCEQAVLSLLAVKYCIPLHRNPDQSGWPVAHGGTYKPEDTYPQLFQQYGTVGNKRDWNGSKFANIHP